MFQIYKIYFVNQLFSKGIKGLCHMYIQRDIQNKVADKSTMLFVSQITPGIFEISSGYH